MNEADERFERQMQKLMGVQPDRPKPLDPAKPSINALCMSYLADALSRRSSREFFMGVLEAEFTKHRMESDLFVEWDQIHKPRKCAFCETMLEIGAHPRTKYCSEFCKGMAGKFRQWEQKHGSS